MRTIAGIVFGVLALAAFVAALNLQIRDYNRRLRALNPRKRQDRNTWFGGN